MTARRARAARLAAWVAVLVVVAADVMIIALGRVDPAAVAWVIASTVAGLLAGVATMVPVVREAQDDARTFMSFGTGPERRSAAPRVPGHAWSAAEPPAAISAARTDTIGVDRAALDARMGRVGARFALGATEARRVLDDRHDRQHDDRRGT